MSHCLVRILVYRHNSAIFFSENELGEAVTVNGDRYQTILNEFLFINIEEEDIGNIWFQQDSAMYYTAEAAIDVWRPVFEIHIISRRADVVWQPRSCDLTPLDGWMYLWCAVKDKSYADKQEIIDALKDNIPEAIGEIQLHTIDNVPKNLTDRIGYCMGSRGSHLNDIIFHY